MKPKVESLLLDALAACHTIERIVKGKGFREYLADENLRGNVILNLIILGEALSQADANDDGIEQYLPELRSVIGMRNRIIHGYRNIDDDIVWDAATNKVPDLAVQLQALLNVDPASESGHETP